MNRDDVTRMAREAGLHIATDVNWMPIIGLEYAERFASLVASAEREVCAKDLYEASEAAKNVDPQGFVWKAVKECADAIRARGQE
jgi:hypothetical protein